ncbi:MAG: InlB B-repeat-containing protein, partial [Clostridiales bacterium]|nr:InlB B-repeat-containing protein [Clostridiales bacterium]
YEMEGFVYSEAYGAYVATIGYCYNTGVKLPTAVVVKTAEGRFFLDGFKIEGENDVLITMPNRDLSGKLLYAQWSEVAFEVKYVADGAEVLTQNYDRGAELSLPNVNEVAYKAGYTGEWGILVDGEWQSIANGTPVTAEMTVVVNYTPNVYQVRFISNEYVEAFGGYEFTYEYTYGTVYKLSEYKIDDFDLAGYYTAANGKGDEVEIIENITSDITLYMYYVDNGVSVTYISGVSYRNDLVMAGGAYKKEITLHDDYELITPAAEGYIFLGWFRRSELENGGYTYVAVTEVGSDRGGAVDVYALWATAAKVTDLTSGYEAKSFLGIYTSSTWSFNGKIEGGGYSDETVSADIVEKLHGRVGVSVSYYVAKDVNGTGDKFLKTETASNAVAQHSFSNSISGSKEDKDFKACRAVLTYTYVTDAGSTTEEFGSEYFARS